MPKKSLNSIGPGVSIRRRGNRWCVRFMLPAEVSRRQGLPREPRLIAEKLKENATSDDLVREANRVGAKIDMLIRGEAVPAEGQSLASWLGLLDTRRRKTLSDTRPSEDSWAALVQAYSEEFKDQTVARENNQRITLARLDAIRQAFPEKHPDAITPRMWHGWIDTLTGGPETKNKFRSIVSRVYKHGIRKHIIETNPIERVARRRRPRSTVKHGYRTLSLIEAELQSRRFTDEEREKMLKWRVLDEAEQNDLVGLAKERKDTGMLVPTILGLHGVSGIDIRQMGRGAYDPKTGIVSGHRFKRGMAAFQVPISPALKSYFDKHFLKVKPGEYAFPIFHVGDQGRPTQDPKDRMFRLWHRTLKESDFEGLRFHSLRHSFISTLLSKGVTAEQVGKFCGHLDSRTTTELYGHFIPDEAVKLIANLNLFKGVG